LKATKGKVIDGDATGLAEVIRDASRRDERAAARKEPGKLSLTERQLYLTARQLLADEIGASRGVDPSEADAWIGDQLAGTDDPGSARVARPAVAPVLVTTAGPSGSRARRRRH
jgi:RNA polymerase-interacting CarD/CdnL/TRCF family regulator